MKSIFEEMGGTYRQVGDYFIPNLVMTDTDNYQIRWSAEDDSYIAEFPMLSGRMADGATVTEALQNLVCTKREWQETAEKKGRKDQAMSPRGRTISSALNDSFNDTAFAPCYDTFRAAEFCFDLFPTYCSISKQISWKHIRKTRTNPPT